MNPAFDWRRTGFLTSNDVVPWQVGPASIGYGDGDDATILADMVNNYTSFYARRSFTINGAFLGGVLLPGALLALLTLWPWLDRSPAAAAGAWFARSRRRQNVVFLILVAAVLILTIVGTFLRGPYWHFYWPWQPWPELPSRI